MAGIKRQRGYTLVEMMVVVGILGIIFALAPKILTDIFQFFRISMARVEIQRDARASLDLMNRRLRQASAATISVGQCDSTTTPSCSATQPPYSKVVFQVPRLPLGSGSDSYSFWQDGRQLKWNQNGSGVRIMADNLRYLAFIYGQSNNESIMSVSVTFEKATYSGRSKALQMAVEKVRIMN